MHAVLTRWVSRIAIAMALVVVVGCGSTAPALVSAPNLFADSEVNPYESVPKALQVNTADVVYATDREPQTIEGVYGYSAKRSRIVSFGLCTVQMGAEDTTWDELVTASTTRSRPEPIPMALTKIDERGRYPSHKGMIEVNGRWVEDPVELEEQAQATQQIHALLSERLALTPRKEIYLFVHGYNNSFASGAFRASQIWHFVGRGGVPVMFSWPAGSTGLLQGYTRDRESGEFANPHLKRLLRDLASCPDVRKIHLIAHSRGTDILGTALREVHNETRAAGKDTRTELKLGQVVLAAPDIDLNVFVERFSADRVGFVAEQITIYASPNDKAIGLSNWLFGSARRIGQLRRADLNPEMATYAKHHPVMDIVDMRGKTDRRGHGYFLSSPAALSDLILVLRDGKRPGAANGRPLYDDPEGFWQLRDGYPFPTHK
jgi:esterase/lipase superfamily enzyme